MRGSAAVKKKSFTEFVKTHTNKMLMNVNTCMICEILEVDMNLLKADVLPLHDQEATPILDVPIAFHQTDKFLIQVPYKKGDIVLVVCSQADIDPLMFGGGKASSRSFSANDALIVGGVNFFTKPLVNEHQNDVVIATKDMNTKLVITENSEIIMKSTKFTVESEEIELKGGDIKFTGASITANGEDLTVDLV